MLCQDVEKNEIAEKYLRGQLDSAVQDEFELHIFDCSRCLASVELLQAVSEDLAARAAEIRSQPSGSDLHIRWSWVVVAALSVLVVTVAISPIRKLFHGHEEKSAQSQEKVILKPETTEAHRDKITAKAGVAPPKQVATAESPESSKTTTTPNSGKNSPLQESSHALAEPSIPTAGGAQQAISNDKVAIAAPGIHPSVVESSQKPREAPKLLSDEGEKELFRLALVNPPPYTFSGFTQYAKDTPSGSTTHGVRPRENKTPDGKRPAFQNAMLAYVDGDYERAGELLALALKQEPPAPDTYFFLGVCRLLQRDAAGSIEPLRLASTQQQHSPFTQSAHFYLAKAYLQMHDLAEAETELEAAASLAGELTGSARAELARLRALRAGEGQ